MVRDDSLCQGTQSPLRALTGGYVPTAMYSLKLQDATQFEVTGSHVG